MQPLSQAVFYSPINSKVLWKRVKNQTNVVLGESCFTVVVFVRSNNLNSVNTIHLLTGVFGQIPGQIVLGLFK